MPLQVAEKFARWWHREEEEAPFACEEAEGRPPARRRLQRLLQRWEDRQREETTLREGMHGRETVLESTPLAPFGEHHLYQLSTDPLSVSPADLSPDDNESRAWFLAWRKRFDCWYLNLPVPTQTQLSGCMGALALHLGSRLDAAVRVAWVSGIERAPRVGTRAPTTDGSGCDWLERPPEEFTLPEFPPFPEVPGASFVLPPIQRLLPSLQRLQEIQARMRDTLKVASPRGGVSWSIDSAPVLIGVGIAACCTIVLGAIRWRRRDGAPPCRLQMRRPSPQAKGTAIGMMSRPRSSMAMSCQSLRTRFT